MPTIRRASPEDIEEVIRLRMAFLQEMKPDLPDWEPVLEATRRYLHEKLPTGEFLVWFAEEGQQVIGTGGLVFFHRPPTTLPSELHAYILNMYTLPDWRRKGIASMLLQHIIEYVRTTPSVSVSLHATEMGRAVYEKLGFIATSNEMRLSL